MRRLLRSEFDFLGMIKAAPAAADTIYRGQRLTTL
jgi:hypothetical protein